MYFIHQPFYKYKSLQKYKPIPCKTTATRRSSMFLARLYNIQYFGTDLQQSAIQKCINSVEAPKSQGSWCPAVSSAWIKQSWNSVGPQCAT